MLNVMLDTALIVPETLYMLWGDAGCWLYKLNILGPAKITLLRMDQNDKSRTQLCQRLLDITMPKDQNKERHSLRQSQDK